MIDLGNLQESSNDLEKLRDTYLLAQKEYLNKLLERPQTREEIVSLHDNFAINSLFETAKSFIDRVENGEIKEEEAEGVKYYITILLAAMHDETYKKVLDQVNADYENSKRESAQNRL